MDLRKIFSVFTDRNKDQIKELSLTISNSLRNKVLMLYIETHEHPASSWGVPEFWEDMHRTFRYKLGQFQLSDSRHQSSHGEDIGNFILNCEAEYLLDFFEYTFKSQYFYQGNVGKNEFVDSLNFLFGTENTPFELTKHITEERQETQYGRQGVFNHTIAEPQIIFKTNKSLHSTSTLPALDILSNPIFKSANLEYLEALEDYRKGDYGDCLTKCGSSFESVMKIICDKKKWKYKQSDTASKLLKIIVDNTSLETYFTDPLIIIATLRNKLSKSHGAGTVDKNPDKHIAQYALNATASAILLLVEEAGTE